MIEQLLTIARNTFTESIRQPIFVVLVLLGVLALILNPSLAAYTLDNDDKLLMDLGLSTIFTISLLLAAFTATGVLASEVENRTVLTVVSKPVARPLFVVGKYLGVAASIALAYLIFTLIFLFTRRHGVMQTASHHFDMPVITFGTLAGLTALIVAAGGNYLFRWVFSSTFVVTFAITQSVAALLLLFVGKEWVFQSPLTEFIAHDGAMIQVLLGLLMIFEAVLVLTAIAIAASTRLGQIMTLIICVGAFLLGLVSNSFSQLVNQRLSLPQDLGVYESITAIFGADLPLHMKLIYSVTKLFYLVLPNLQFLWPADAINLDYALSGSHIATLSTYALLNVAVVMAVAVALFQTREVG